MVQGTGQDGGKSRKKRLRLARVLQRRALLVSPTGPIKAARRRGGKALRIGPWKRIGAAAQNGQLRPRLPAILLSPPRRPPPAAPLAPRRTAARPPAEDPDHDPCLE